MTNNASETLAALNAARMGWMTGQLTQVELPGFEQIEPPEAHLRLLAMDSQLRSLTAASQAAENLTIVSEFSIAERVLPPAPARDRFKRLWADAQVTDKVLLLRLLDRRGYISHPFDFLPEAHWDGLPDAYLPLLEWQHSIAGDAAPSAPAPYAAYSREVVQRTYRTLRTENPAKARTWLEAELVEGNAQSRLRLLQDLSSQFDQSDAELLGSLHKSDRSSKVKTFALQALRRLGASTELPSDLSAFDYFERGSKGLLRRKTKISAPSKMNATRVNLLKSLIAQIGFGDVAQHFSLTERELIDAWDWTDSHQAISDTLRRSVLETGSDDGCSYLMDQFPEALLDLKDLSADVMQRLTGSLRAKAIHATIHAGGKPAQTLWNVPEALCSWHMEDLTSEESKALWAKASQHPNFNPPKEDTAPGLSNFANELFKLAMCLQPQDAQLALEQLINKHGLHSADPLLTPFHFNLALAQVTGNAPTERP